MNQMIFEQMQHMNELLVREKADNYDKGKLPSQPVNPNGEVKAIHTLRSGTQYTDPPLPEEGDPSVQVRTNAETTRQQTKQPSADKNCDPQHVCYGPQHHQNAEQNREQQTDALTNKSVAQPEPYRPQVPFPQRLAKTRLDEQYTKFMEILKQLKVSIPFIDIMLEMPSYSKFLKEIISNKRSLKDCKKVQLNREVSDAIINEMPLKLQDPGRFTIPCSIGKVFINKALCDLGASVSLMPYTMFKKIGLGELKSTLMTIQLADSTAVAPLGIAEDMPIRVGKFYVPGDFVVMDMKEDEEVPIILGRPFLRTARTTIDTHEGTLTMHFGDEEVRYRIEDPIIHAEYSKECYMVDILSEPVHKKREEKLHPKPSTQEKTKPINQGETHQPKPPFPAKKKCPSNSLRNFLNRKLAELDARRLVGGDFSEDSDMSLKQLFEEA